MILKYMQIALYMIFITGIKFSIHAQTNEKTSRELYHDYISNIDISDLKTGYVLNKGFIDDDEINSLHQFIETYDEETNQVIPPISQMDGMSWMQIYSRLKESEVSVSSKLPSVEELNTRLENNNSSSSIPILIFDVKGELLEDTDIKNSIENLPKENSYNEVHLFGAISYTSISYKKRINFELKSENYLSGFYKKESEVFIDFADGRGVQKYNSSQGVIPVNYTDFGEKLIRVYRNATLNGVSMKIGSSFIITIKANNTENSTTVLKSTISPKSSETKTGSIIKNYGGHAHLYLGNDKVFDKPIIIVQGFDPIGTITVDEQRKKYSNFEKGLRNNNYDIVYLIFNNTNLSLQDNTNVVKDLIQQINSKKQRNFESIVIGESMGGLLSRMALKQLENESYDHRVGLYVSFDAPHQGANLPPGIQYLFKDIMESRTVSDISSRIGIIDRTIIDITNFVISPFTEDRIPQLRDVLKINMAHKALAALNSVAAKSMLVRHISTDGYFNAAQNNLKRLGYPSNSRNIALINGSNESRDVQKRLDGATFTPGEQLIRFPLWRTDCNEFSLNAWSSPVNTTAKVSQIILKVGIKVPDVRIRWENRCIVKIFGKCKLRGKVPVKVKVGLKCATTNLINKKRNYSFNGASYDNAPGSTLPGLRSLPFDITANIAFVPTVSSIDLSDDAYNSSTDPKGLRAIINSTVIDDFIRNNQIPFDEVYSKAWNSNHVFFASDDITNFRTIIADEFMFENLDIQNKVITNDRDFEANNVINIGNDINTRDTKIFNSGNVVVENKANVNLIARNQITLYPGTHFKSGSIVNVKLNKKASQKLNSKPLDADFQIKIIGAKEYIIGKSSPSFKILSSDPNSEYDYSWQLIENTKITSSNDEFIIDEFLYPNIYTIKVKVTSKKSLKTKTLTKILKISTDFDLEIEAKKGSLELVGVSNTIQVYPNPVVNNVTVIAQKEISKVVIYDLFSKIVLKTEGINKTWQSFDLANLSSGTYVCDIHFVDNSSSIQKKIFKK
ncbi:T9SS type A sorting domain-containing protein [Aquimarina longa]|uniref:T9SS type A sorting domain-containing protein n=1 Tax=Aquimarina longa TaxID=1080221 RepID=UPI00130E2E7A|nr:T9SS type A sorting domain-containing protein [Aquimarina longa]